MLFLLWGGVEGRRDVGKRWDRILGKQIKHPNGQILFSIEWMRRNDCCRVLDDAILHGSLNFSSLSPITLHYSPIRRRFPLPSAAKRATSFFSRRFIGNNVFPLPLLRWFLFLGGEIPVEDDGKNGEIIVDPLVDFLGGISNFSLSFLIYSRIWNKKEKLDRSITMSIFSLLSLRRNFDWHLPRQLTISITKSTKLSFRDAWNYSKIEGRERRKGKSSILAESDL